MKKITLFLALLITSLVFSQQETFEVTFETGTAGSDASKWNVFENDSNPALEIVANPDATGNNTSTTVAKFTALSTGEPYAGAETVHANLGEWVLETGNNTISIMVYKTVISDVTVKFVNATNGTIFQLAKPNTTINAWETLTYDISGAIASGENHNIDQLVIFPEWSARTANTVTYFDNVVWSAKRTKAAATVSGGNTVGSPEGTWKLASQAGALMVGNQGAGSSNWWSNDAASVTARACLFDDQYVLASGGVFTNVQGSDTWLEAWQGVADGCGTPIAPHNNSNAATWVYDSSANTITVTGQGAYLGLAKPHNNGELAAPGDAPASITYTVAELTSTSMILDLNFSADGWWRFVFTKEAAADSDATLSDLQVNSTTISGFDSNTENYIYGGITQGDAIPQITATTTENAASTIITQATAIPGNASVVVTAEDGTTMKTYTISFEYSQTPEGTWKLASQAGALMVGNQGAGSSNWWSNDAASVSARACLFDDQYVLASGGVFTNVQGSDTWLEAWQGVADGCGTPVAPHNNSNAATWVYDSGANTITVTGQGAYLGLAKPHNNGELAAPGDAPASITYTVAELTSTSMILDLNFSADGWWRFVFAKETTTASVSDNELLNISMYPNPTSSRLNISAQSTIKNATIYNILGKQVMSLNIQKNSKSIDVSNLSSGIYIIRYTIDKAVGTAKFIKQ